MTIQLGMQVTVSKALELYKTHSAELSGMVFRRIAWDHPMCVLLLEK